MLYGKFKTLSILIYAISREVSNLVKRNRILEIKGISKICEAYLINLTLIDRAVI